MARTKTRRSSVAPRRPDRRPTREEDLVPLLTSAISLSLRFLDSNDLLLSPAQSLSLSSLLRSSALSLSSLIPHPSEAHRPPIPRAPPPSNPFPWFRRFLSSSSSAPSDPRWLETFRMSKPSFYLLLRTLSPSLSSLSRPDLLLSLLRRRPSSVPFSSPTHFNRLLLALSSHPSSLPSALSLLRSSPSPSLRSFNILISAFARSGNLSLACSLFNSISETPHLAPDAETYRVLTQALCRRSQLGTALRLLDDMHNKGMAADKLTYSTLLNSLCRRKGRLREAYKVLCRMKAKGCDPDAGHYDTLVAGFCREGRPLDARKVFDDMSRGGCSPNAATYASLVNGLCGRGLVEEANGYLGRMVGEGFVPHFSVFHGVVKGFCGVGKADEACGVVDVMLGLGVAPHVDTWALVASAICCDDEDYLRENVLLVLKDGFRPGGVNNARAFPGSDTRSRKL